MILYIQTFNVKMSKLRSAPRLSVHTLCVHTSLGGGLGVLDNVQNFVVFFLMASLVRLSKFHSYFLGQWGGHKCRLFHLDRVKGEAGLAGSTKLSPSLFFGILWSPYQLVCSTQLSYLRWNKWWLYPGGGRAQKWSLYLQKCLLHKGLLSNLKADNFWWYYLQ